jgi:soluble lytic murein transglycosylase-like protein
MLEVLILFLFPVQVEEQTMFLGTQIISGERRPPYRAGQEPKETVKEMIIRLSEEYGVNTDTALRIAWCESRFDPLAKNPNSSASGVFQFLSGTYEYIGGKDVFDPEENIRLFMEWYPRFPNWWECK